MCGFIAQLVEQRTGNAEVTGSNPVEALIFFRLLLSNWLNWKIYCDDHSSLSGICMETHTSVTGWQKLFFLYKFFEVSVAVVIATFEIYGQNSQVT